MTLSSHFRGSFKDVWVWPYRTGNSPAPSSLGAAWRLISGTALDTVLARRLQDGGHRRPCGAAFCVSQSQVSPTRSWIGTFGRKDAVRTRPYKLIPMYKQRVSVERQQLTMLANFVEVYLAKEGHSGPVGINLG